MNKSELEVLTRDELLAMARSAGVDGAEWLSREELVTALERAQSRARGGLFGRARALFERALDLGQLFGRKSEPRKERPEAPTRPSTPAVATAPPAHEGDRGPLNAPPPVTTQGPSAENQFQTLTMAEVYAAQGLIVEAQRIVEAIAAREPSNTAAAALLRRLQDQSAAPPAKEMGPMFLDLEEPKERYGEDVISLFMVAPTDLYSYWEVTAERRQLACRSLGEDGELVLRLFTATASGTSTRDVDVASDVGEWFIHEATAGARHVAAIGLRTADGRFAPIAHSSPVLTPLPEPSADTRVEWLEVKLRPRGPELQRPQVVDREVAEVRVQARARRRALEGWPKGSSELHIDRGRG